MARLRNSEEVLLVLTALIVGAGSGVGAVIFRYLIRTVERLGYDWLPSLNLGIGRGYIILVPAVGGLVVGLLVFFLAREAKGHGVPEVMEAVALRGGRIRPRVAVVKALASALRIGSGGSVGREGPIVQIGSALGSTVGQLVRLPDERIRNLVACGAAGGIAALQTLLYRYTGQEDILTGFLKSGRSPRTARVAGYFVNPIVVRGRLAGPRRIRGTFMPGPALKMNQM